MPAWSLVAPSAARGLPKVVIRLSLEALAMCAFGSFVVATLQFSVQCAAYECAAGFPALLGQGIHGLEKIIF